VYPVGNCLIIAAYSKKEAFDIAERTITHTNIKENCVIEIKLDKPKVIEYLSGNY